MKICGYIVVSFQVVVSGQLWAHFKYRDMVTIGSLRGILRHHLFKVFVFGDTYCSKLGFERLLLKLQFLFLDCTASAS